PGHARHRHIQDRDLGPLGEHLLDGLDAVLGFGDDLEVRLAVEKQLQPGADDPVVVRNHDPHSPSPSVMSRGTSSLTLVPLPGLESNSSLPPTSRARSRMPDMPSPLFSSAKAKPRPSSDTSSRTWE